MILYYKSQRSLVLKKLRELYKDHGILIIEYSVNIHI